MSHVFFQVQPPIVPADPNRADIACFVGFVAQRKDAIIPAELRGWLCRQNWLSSRDLCDENRQVLGKDLDLKDKPVLVERWNQFDSLFAWDLRDAVPGLAGGSTYLGAAVRSFFAQGGRSCYVVRVGDPWATGSQQSVRLKALDALIPGWNPASPSATPLDRRTWKGLAVLFGLPDVAMVVLPDLADAVAVDLAPVPVAITIPDAPERFVDCSGSGAGAASGTVTPGVTAPRCDDNSYQHWFRALRLALSHFEAHRDAVPHLASLQLIAAVPVPMAGSSAEAGLLPYLLHAGVPAGPLAIDRKNGRQGLSSAFLQLAYPWVRTPGSSGLPEQVEPPDAVLAGVIARNAMAQGTYLSAAGQHLADVYDVTPELPRDQVLTPLGPAPARPLVDRVSLLGPTAQGLRLLSDVTTSLDPGYQPACVGRLVSSIVRAAARVGEEAAFETSDGRLWGRVRTRLEGLLNEFLEAGALQGATPDDAFQVRCGSDTMTQNDIDSGRLIAKVGFSAAMPIDEITVVFAMSEGGQPVTPPTVSTP
jgi:hypothetical protein